MTRQDLVRELRARPPAEAAQVLREVQKPTVPPASAAAAPPPPGAAVPPPPAAEDPTAPAAAAQVLPEVQQPTVSLTVPPASAAAAPPPPAAAAAPPPPAAAVQPPPAAPPPPAAAVPPPPPAAVRPPAVTVPPPQAPVPPTASWRTLRTPNLEISVHWPGGRVPASLIVDDPMPGLNPMIDHEPGYPHRRSIPNDVLRRFADLSERHGIQGKFSVLPWPLALGRLDRPETLPPESRAALPEFTELVRERIMPRYDITCEFLTHARAIDLATGEPTAETERQWASHATAEEFADTIALAGRILGDAGLPMDGVTSPWDSGKDNEAAYAHGVALAMRRRGRALAWYFLHCEDKTLDVLPRITYRGNAGLTVSIVVGAGTDPGWKTQTGGPVLVDPLIDADGRGRLTDLVAGGRPVVVCTHWQSLYGNGSLGGLHAIDLLADRLRQRHGDRLDWVPLGRHAEMAAACATLEAREEKPPHGGGNWRLRLTTPFPTALADITLRGLTAEGREWLARPLAFSRTPLRTRPAADEAVCLRMPLCDGLLEATVP